MDNLLSRSVDYLASAFPGWANARMVNKMRGEYLATLAPLKSDRASGPVHNSPTSLDEKITWWDRRVMIDTYDTLIHENPLLSGLVDTFVYNTIPATGLRPIPTTDSDEFNAEAAKRFEDWAENCDVRGVLNFWEFQQVLFKTTLGHGDAGTALMADGRIQGVDALRIATPNKYAAKEGSQIHQGVYTGAGVEPRGYYDMPVDRYGNSKQDKFRFIPAQFFHHSYRSESFTHYRGASPFLSSYRHLKQVQAILKYKEFQQKMASVFGIAIKKSKDKITSPLQQIGSSAESRSANKTGTRRKDFELFPGMGITLDADEDMQVVDSKSPGAEFESFVRLVARFIGLSCGLPLEFVLQDWSKANYYGNKMSAGAGKRVFLNWWRVPAKFTRRIYLWKTSQFIEAGTLTPPTQTETGPYSCDLTLPPPIEVDDGKAFDAHMSRVMANVDTLENWTKSQGKSLQRILKQREKEIGDQKEADLPIPATSSPGIKLLSELENEQ